MCDSFQMYEGQKGLHNHRMSASFIEAVIQRTRDALGIISWAERLPCDVIACVLIALPVPDRLRAIQLSQAWRIMGGEAASWSACDFVEDMDFSRRWSGLSIERIVHTALRKAGTGLTRLSMHGTQLYGSMLQPLRGCTKLQELDVSLSVSSSITYADVLAALPSEPFVLARLKIDFRGDGVHVAPSPVTARTFTTLRKRVAHLTCYCTSCASPSEVDQFSSCCECDRVACAVCSCWDCGVGSCCERVVDCRRCNRTLCGDCMFSADGMDFYGDSCEYVDTCNDCCRRDDEECRRELYDETREWQHNEDMLNGCYDDF